jgi:hypothetical protein
MDPLRFQSGKTHFTDSKIQKQRKTTGENGTVYAAKVSL